MSNKISGKVLGMKKYVGNIFGMAIQRCSWCLIVKNSSETIPRCHIHSNKASHYVSVIYSLAHSLEDRYYKKNI